MAEETKKNIEKEIKEEKPEVVKAKVEKIEKETKKEENKTSKKETIEKEEKKDINEKPTEIKEEVKEKETIKEESQEEPKKETPKRKEKEERIAVLNIYTTFNNTIINMTDLSGKSISKFSGGQSTKQDRLKANPTVAMFIAQRVSEEARDNGITGFYVKIRSKTGQNNPGPGAHAAIKSLTRSGFRILSIMDTTRIARGGPKKKGGRRGRRV